MFIFQLCVVLVQTMRTGRMLTVRFVDLDQTTYSPQGLCYHRSHFCSCFMLVLGCSLLTPFHCLFCPVRVLIIAVLSTACLVLFIAHCPSCCLQATALATRLVRQTTTFVPSIEVLLEFWRQKVVQLRVLVVLCQHQLLTRQKNVRIA